MTDSQHTSREPPMMPSTPGDAEVDETEIDDPAELVRIGAMLARLNTELQQIDLDEPTVDRLVDLHEQVLTSLRENLSPDLTGELQRMVPALGDGTRSESEVRVAHLQLVGWLGGLFQGVQMSAMGQQLRQQIQQQSQAGLPQDQPSGMYL